MSMVAAIIVEHIMITLIALHLTVFGENTQVLLSKNYQIKSVYCASRASPFRRAFSASRVAPIFPSSLL